MEIDLEPQPLTRKTLDDIKDSLKKLTADYRFDETITDVIFNVDCIKLLRLLPDKCITVSIIDPPYGINLQKMRLGKGTKHYVKREMFDDTKPPDIEYWHHLFRVSRYVVAFGANHYMHRLEQAIGKQIDSPSWIIWDKGRRNDFADAEMAWTNFGKPVRIFSFLWDGYKQGNQKEKEKRIHPNHKPIILYKWIMSKFNIKGLNEKDEVLDEVIILDTHLGSGSSRIAAAQFGISFIGAELSPTYYDDSVKRFKQEFLDRPKLDFEDEKKYAISQLMDVPAIFDFTLTKEEENTDGK